MNDENTGSVQNCSFSSTFSSKWEPDLQSSGQNVLAPAGSATLTLTQEESEQPSSVLKILST